MSQINVNNIRAKDGVGAVGFPGGINATGVVTATSFSGNLTGNLTGNVTGNTSGTAGGLTGTPNITVGTVTGTDATFSGNLTVNGTTTTIDTAVTAVDSLAVDGSITALGNCAIGTVTPTPSNSAYNGASLHLHNPGGSGNGSQIHLTNGTTGNAAGDGAHISMWSDSGLYITNQESAGFVNFSGGGYSNRMTVSQHGAVKFGAPLTEKCNRDSGAGLSGNYVHHLKTYGNVHWATNNSSATWTYDITGDGSTDLNDMMTDQETLSFQLISSQNNSSYYMTELRIDGSNAHTVWWQGGSAPSAGGASGYDVYTFTIFKRLNASFRIFASLTNHA